MRSMSSYDHFTHKIIRIRIFIDKIIQVEIPKTRNFRARKRKLKSTKSNVYTYKVDIKKMLTFKTQNNRSQWLVKTRRLFSELNTRQKVH